MIILKAQWVLPVSGVPIEKDAVAIDGSKIAGAGRAGALTKAHPDAEVIDFGLAAILPGFVDLHTHLEFSVFRGLCDDLDYVNWKMQVTEKSAPLTAEDWRLSARLGALEAVRSGITCIADITRSGASLDAALAAGLRGRVYYEISGMEHGRIPDTMGEAEQTVEAWGKLAQGTAIEIGIAPHSPYTVAPPLFQAASLWAQRRGVPVCTHLAGSRAEYDFVKYASGLLATEYRELVGWSNLLWQPTGASPVKYLEQWDILDSDLMAVHCVQVDEADIEILKKYDVAVAHCPKCSAKLGMGIAPLPDFRRSGLRMGLGTDSPASNNTMDVFDEMRVGLLLQRGAAQSVDGLSAEEFVRMATLGGAQALGLDQKIGSLDAGKEADVIAVDLSHSHQIPTRDPYSALVYTANQEDVVFSMVGGRYLYRQGEHATLDASDVLERVQPLRQKLK